jgi:glutamate transport system substrate-binding protein
MKKQLYSLAALFAAGTLALAACGGSSGGASATVDTGGYQTTKADSLPASATLDAIKARGKIIIGTKFDQPLFGLQNPTNGRIDGFDAEIGRLLALRIFGDPNKVSFIESVSKNREPYIQQGKVDAVIATYTINDKRKALVDFAGPYYTAGQDIMVKTGDTSIAGVTDLNGKKVCTVTGSTSATNLTQFAPTAQPLLLDTYSACAEALGDGRVQAVTTDNVVLLGLISRNPSKYTLVGKSFTQEPYGIGLKTGDDAFRSFVNDTLATAYTNGDWALAFTRTVGAVAKSTPTPPALDRYTGS